MPYLYGNLFSICIISFIIPQMSNPENTKLDSSLRMYYS